MGCDHALNDNQRRHPEPGAPRREIEVCERPRPVDRVKLHSCYEASVGRKRIPTSPASPFYGFPAEVIAEWCGVSIGTAEHYKASRRKPPTPVLRLFRLYRDGKVLGPEWDDYRVIGDRLFGPDGKHIRPNDIVLWGIGWQLLAEKYPDQYHALLLKHNEAQVR